MYNLPSRSTYSYQGIAIGAGTVLKYIKGPSGKKGRVVEIMVSPTTSLVGTGTPGKVQMGDGVTANKYADLFLGTAGAPAQAGAPVVASAVTKIGTGAALKGQDNNNLPFVDVAADQVITVTFLQPVGTPAGVVDATITVDWDV